MALETYVFQTSDSFPNGESTVEKQNKTLSILVFVAVGFVTIVLTFKVENNVTSLKKIGYV